MKDVDFTIFGGGLISKILAISLLKSGYEICYINLNQKKTNFNNRYFSLNFSSIEFLLRLGILEKIKIEEFNSVFNIKVYDKNLNYSELEFDSLSNNILYFSKIVSEESLCEGVDEHFNSFLSEGLHYFKCNSEEVDFSLYSKKIKLPNSRVFQSKFLFVADGSNSITRYKLDFKVEEYNFFQRALTGHVEISDLEVHTAYQWFLDKSILALLPLSKNNFSFVWSCPLYLEQELNNAEEEKIKNIFINEMNQKIKDISFKTEFSTFPIFQKYVRSIKKNNFLLIGDAAHVIHPLAGQGMNLGLMDIQVLNNILNGKKCLDDIELLIEKYSRIRHEKVQKMKIFTQNIQILFSNQNKFSKSLRLVGFKMLQKIPLFKNFLVNNAID